MIQFEDYKDAKQTAANWAAPAHKYTIHLHRAMYTDELFDLYKRYELAVHKKERLKANLTRFLCNSPLYDSEKEPHIATNPMYFKTTNVDKFMHTF